MKYILFSYLFIFLSCKSDHEINLPGSYSVSAYELIDSPSVIRLPKLTLLSNMKFEYACNERIYTGTWTANENREFEYFELSFNIDNDSMVRTGCTGLIEGENDEILKIDNPSEFNCSNLRFKSLEFKRVYK